MILHCISSFCNSGRIGDSAGAGLEYRASTSRGGDGRFRIAIERAADADRTAEIRREASRIPQRRGGPPEISALGAVLISSWGAWPSLLWIDDPPFAFGESARYSGLPTRNASCCGGVALRMSSQNLSRWPCSFSMLISTRLYRSARHQERASLISAAQSTSMPSLLIVSARSSRLLGEVSTRRTRLFLTGPRIGFESGNASIRVVMQASHLVWRLIAEPPCWSVGLEP